MFLISYLDGVWKFYEKNKAVWYEKENTKMVDFGDGGDDGAFDGVYAYGVRG